MRSILALVLVTIAMAGSGRAQGEVAGRFDYYVLSLSWSANWCVLEGDARRSPQCGADRDHDWVLHGLWPQFHDGYPSYCRTDHRAPSRAMTAAMADIMGTSGLAWHQWKKHGSCTGLSASDYYSLSREAYARIARPGVFRRTTRAIALPAAMVEEAFLKANPDLDADQITITCKQNHIQETRICLSRDLDPVPCGRDVSRDCTLEDALLAPMR